jgi:hypothetical protein
VKHIKWTNLGKFCPSLLDKLPGKNIALEVKWKGNLRDYHKLSNLADSLGIKGYYVISQSFSPENGIIPVTEVQPVYHKRD